MPTVERRPPPKDATCIQWLLGIQWLPVTLTRTCIHVAGGRRDERLLADMMMMMLIVNYKLITPTIFHNFNRLYPIKVIC